MAITLQSSSLKTAANKIVATNTRSEGSFIKLRNDYQKFGNFLDLKVLELERIQLPSTNTIRKVTNINVSNTFGSAGGLLGSLLGGALDLGGFIRGFFPGKDKKIGAAPKGTPEAAKPTVKGNRLRIGGMRAYGVANALFAGLDFATGLAQGESIGKSAAGTAGSLAGSLLGGAIGQTLIPVPGLGFVIGSMAGSFMGGWSADRVYDASTGKVERFQESKLERGKKPTSQDQSGLVNVEKQGTVLSKFDGAVNKFEDFVKGILDGKLFLQGISQLDDDSTNTPPQTQPPGNGEISTVEGGDVPSKYALGGYMEGRRHFGVDYQYNVNAPGTPISIIKPGVVTYAGWDKGGYGNLVIVKHPNGIESLYGHLHQIKVKVNQQIEPGTVIGTEGTTGRSTGYHVHFELRPAGGGGGTGIRIDKKEGDNYFRYGGSVRVTSAPGIQEGIIMNAPSTSGMKPGETVSTAFGRQSSMPTANIPGRNKPNMKGYLIVPGHIAGSGTAGEAAAVQKIAKNVVSRIQAMYPGVPIQLWNNRNYPQSDAGFSKQMDDLKRKESEGWEVIELHLDAPGGTGRGIITPVDQTKLNPLESILAGRAGAYPSNWRNGLAGPRRNIGLLELANATPELIQAIMNNDQRAMNFVGADIINAIKLLIEQGGLPNYRPAPRAQARPSQPRVRNISYELPYNRPNSSQIAFISNPTVIAMGGGSSNRRASVTSTPTNQTGGGSPVYLSSTQGSPRDVLNSIQEFRLVV